MSCERLAGRKAVDAAQAQVPSSPPEAPPEAPPDVQKRVADDNAMRLGPQWVRLCTSLETSCSVIEEHFFYDSRLEESEETEMWPEREQPEQEPASLEAPRSGAQQYVHNVIVRCLLDDTSRQDRDCSGRAFDHLCATTFVRAGFAAEALAPGARVPVTAVSLSAALRKVAAQRAAVGGIVNTNLPTRPLAPTQSSAELPYVLRTPTSKKVLPAGLSSLEDVIAQRKQDPLGRLGSLDASAGLSRARRSRSSSLRLATLAAWIEKAPQLDVMRMSDGHTTQMGPDGIYR